MGIANGYNDEKRQAVIIRAKAATMLDAAFYMVYYNREQRLYGPGPTPPEISTSEIFNGREMGFDVLNAVAKASDLLGDTYDLMDALYQGDSKRSEQAMSALKSRYSGFSDECYGMVSHRAQRSAR